VPHVKQTPKSTGRPFGRGAIRKIVTFAKNSKYSFDDDYDEMVIVEDEADKCTISDTRLDILFPAKIRLYKLFFTPASMNTMISGVFRSQVSIYSIH